MRQRRYRTLAAYIGGAATMAGALVAGLISGQVWYARRTIPGAQAPPPPCGGRYGQQYEGPPISLAVLGDSTAAGYGVHTRAQTPGAMLATAVADHARRPVVLTCTAAVGSPSAWLPAQAENVLDAGGADLAVIFIGANDVTGGVDEEQAVAFLAEAVRALRRAGSEVVVATCPDLGSIPPIMPPLRWLVRRWSRQMARAQRKAVEAEGAYTVPLGELLGPVFDADPDTLFGPDRYHPSAAGYRAAVDVLLPTVLRVLDAALARGQSAGVDGGRPSGGRVDRARPGGVGAAGLGAGGAGVAGAGAAEVGASAAPAAGVGARAGGASRGEAAGTGVGGVTHARGRGGPGRRDARTDGGSRLREASAERRAGRGGVRAGNATKGADADLAGRTPGGAVPCVSQSHSNA